MSVRGTGQAGGIPPGKEPESLPSSDRGSQTESNGSLLSKIQAKQSQRYKGVFFLGRIEAHYINKSVKNNYVQELQKLFTQKASSQKYEGATQTFETFLAPKLKQARLEEIQYFESFIHKHPVSYFMGAAHSERGQKVFGRVVENVIEAMQENPHEVDRISTNFHKTQTLFGTLGLVNEFEYFNTFLMQLTTEYSDYVQTVDRHEAFISEAEKSKPFKEHISQKSDEDKGIVLKFSFTEPGHVYLMEMLRTGTTPDRIKEAIDFVLDTQKSGKDLIAAATLRSASRIMEHLKSEERFKYMEAWIESSQDLEPDDFDDFLKRFSEHLLNVEKFRASQEETEKVELKRNIDNSFEALARDYPQQIERFNFLNLR